MLSGLILISITVLSLRPLDTLPDLPGGDKLRHFLAYGTLMFPVALAKPKRWLTIGLFFAGWSGVIELIQPYVNRYGEWQDLVANIFGLVLGAVIATVLRRFNVRRHEEAG